MSPNDDDRLHAEIARAVRAGLPQPAPGFEHRLTAAVSRSARASERPAGTRLTVAVSVALSVLVVAGMLWASPGFRGRLLAVGHEPVPAGQPASSARQAATTPPGGAERFPYMTIVTKRIASGPLHWAEWSGAILPDSPLPDGAGDADVSPDGRYLIRQGDPPVVTTTGSDPVEVHVTPGTMQITDESGAVVATAEQSGLDLWADDSRHLCGLDLNAGGWPSAVRLGAIVPGRGLVMSRVPISGLPARSGGYLAGCSVMNDRAVLLPIPAGTGSMYGIQLSTGRVVFTRAAPAGATGVVISSDQRYAAMTAPGAHLDRPSTEVMDLDSGAVVARLAGTAVGFSGDDQLVALDATWNSGPASLVEWRTGRTVWRSEPLATIANPMDLRSRPGGRAMALTLTNPDSTPDVVLIESDGTSKVIAGDAEVVTLGLVGAAG